MKSPFRFLRFAALLTILTLAPGTAMGVGRAANTEWPDGARVDVQLKLTAVIGKDGKPQISGVLTVTNPTNEALLVQKPTNRMALAFLVFDALGNPVTPKGAGKADPGFETSNLAPRATLTHEIGNLEFTTGSMVQGYALGSGQKYRVIAVYRAAGPSGPGFTSGEVVLQIP